MKKDSINPEELFVPRGFSHAVLVSSAHKTLYIGGQNAVDKEGKLVGGNNLKDQTAKILNNIGAILNDVGAKPDDIVKLDIHVKQGLNPQEGFEAFQETWPNLKSLPVITVVFVAGFGNPDWLVEIDAVAAIPE
jgi:enamine deaminase RidA (YjgF/YER057c/UK114 family)